MTAPRVLAIVGATATGKTALAEAVAERLGGELVAADSRQVFRELEIGTGKPTPAERAARPHHLFEALQLGQRSSAGWYARASLEIRAAIHARGRIPILVGGSGLYLAAAERGLSTEPPHDPAIRARLRAELEARGPEALHATLARIDPETAARVKPRDRQRVTRALEVWEASGRPLSWWHDRRDPVENLERWTTLELVLEPAVLDARIVARTRWMFDHGLIEETRGLIDRDLGAPLRALRAIGYHEALGLIEGRLDRGAAEQRTCLRTRQLAKRQRTWFRHQVRATRIAADGAEERLIDLALEAFERGEG